MEYFFTCPYCWQEISFVLDDISEKQRYIEDCEVCCNPIEIYFELTGNEVTFFEAVKANH